MESKVNNGEIWFNKELTKEAINLLNKEFGKEWGCEDYLSVFEEGVKSFMVDDYHDPEFDKTLERTIKVLKPLGYVLDGCIDYSDYDGCVEGTIYVENNEISVYDIEDRWKKDAVDHDIIEVLRTRGYTIIKNKPEAEIEDTVRKRA